MLLLLLSASLASFRRRRQLSLVLVAASIVAAVSVPATEEGSEPRNRPHHQFRAVLAPSMHIDGAAAGPLEETAAAGGEPTGYTNDEEDATGGLRGMHHHHHHFDEAVVAGSGGSGSGSGLYVPILRDTSEPLFLDSLFEDDQGGGDDDDDDDEENSTEDLHRILQTKRACARSQSCNEKQGFLKTKCIDDCFVRSKCKATPVCAGKKSKKSKGECVTRCVKCRRGQRCKNKRGKAKTNCATKCVLRAECAKKPSCRARSNPAGKKSCVGQCIFEESCRSSCSKKKGAAKRACLGDCEVSGDCRRICLSESQIGPNLKTCVDDCVVEDCRETCANQKVENIDPTPTTSDALSSQAVVALSLPELKYVGNGLTGLGLCEGVSEIYSAHLPTQCCFLSLIT